MKSKQTLNLTTISLIPLVLTISACEITSDDLILFIVLVAIMGIWAPVLVSERLVSCSACGTRLYLTGKKIGTDTWRGKNKANCKYEARCPKCGETEFVKGIAYARLWLGSNDGEAAIAKYRKAIAIDPNDAEAHYSLALAYIFQNHKALTIQCLRTAISLDKNMIERVKSDSALDNIRESPEFQSLISSVE